MRRQLETIGVAIAGTGFMGMAHVEALRRVGVRLVGCLGSTLEKSRRFAERWNLPRAYATFAELLSDTEVHAVHLATPNTQHVAMARQAIQAGKHVLCEKPLATSALESAELVELAARHSALSCGVNYNVRFYPLCVEAREQLRSGAWGEIFHIGGSYVQDWLLERDDYNWRVLAEQGGELRAMADIGTHWLDLVQHLTGLSVTAVCAALKTVHAKRFRPESEIETFAGPAPTDSTHLVETSSIRRSVPVTTDDYGAVLLRFDNGAQGVLWVSQVTAGRKNCIRFEIAAQRHAVAWNSEQPDELWIGDRHAANRLLARDPALLSPAARAVAGYPGGHVEGYPDTFKQLFRAFYSAVECGAGSDSSRFPTFADGHREMVLCEAMLASHRRQAWVEVGGPEVRASAT